MARDEAMAGASSGRDFYIALVDAGVVATRDEAKYAILGAMYGATTGESGRLVPRLARAFPHAMALVDRAAREGERGGSVTTLLGRSSPPPSAQWRAIQARASEPEATSADERRARSSARDWGRFTRNFVVQGSAAEWSLCWMAALRGRLEQIAAHVPDATPSAQASGPVFARAPHLVYFLHDEIIVHSPQEVAHEVAAAVEDAAREAGTLLFGDFRSSSRSTSRSSTATRRRAPSFTPCRRRTGPPSAPRSHRAGREGDSLGVHDSVEPSECGIRAGEIGGCREPNERRLRGIRCQSRARIGGIRGL